MKRKWNTFPLLEKQLPLLGKRLEVPEVGVGSGPHRAGT